MNIHYNKKPNEKEKKKPKPTLNKIFYGMKPKTNKSEAVKKKKKNKKYK